MNLHRFSLLVIILCFAFSDDVKSDQSGNTVAHISPAKLVKLVIQRKQPTSDPDLKRDQPCFVFASHGPEKSVELESYSGSWNGIWMGILGNLHEILALSNFNAEALELRFYAPYLLQGLQSFSEDEQITAFLKSNSKPIIFKKNSDDCDLIYLVMPVSANN